MRLRWRVLLYVGIGLLVVAGLFGAIYSYFAFAPTGYESLMRAQQPSLDRVSAMVSLREDGPTSPSMMASPASQPQARLSLVELLMAVESQFVIRQSLLLPVRDFEWLFSKERLPEEEVFAVRPARAEVIEGLSLLAKSLPNSPPPRAMQAEGEMSERMTTTKIEEEVERVLLDPQPPLIPAFSDFLPRHATQVMFYQYLAVSAIMRRAKAGNLDDARRMLRRHMDILRSLDAGLFPSGILPPGSSSSRESTLASLIALARTGIFDDAIYRELDAQLATLRWSPQQVTDLRVAHGQRWRAFMDRQLTMDNLQPHSTTFHFFMNGWPDNILRRAMIPVARREVDSLAKAYATGDIIGAYRTIPAYKRALRLLSADMREQCPYFSSIEEFCASPDSDSVSLNHNISLELARIALAMEYQRNRTGRYPNRVEDLGLSDLTAIPDLQGFQGHWRVGCFEPSPGSFIPYVVIVSGPYPFRMELTGKILPTVSLYGLTGSADRRALISEAESSMNDIQGIGWPGYECEDTHASPPPLPVRILVM